MQIRAAVGMLAALVLVLLAPSMTEGLVLTRCEMEQYLNQTLPANITSNISPGNTSTNASSDAAHIVCYAELVSGLNTSKVSQPTNTPDHSAEDHHHKHDESSESSAESKPSKSRRQRSLSPEPKSAKGGDAGKPSKPNNHTVTHPPISHTEPPKHRPTGASHHNSSETSAESKPHKFPTMAPNHVHQTANHGHGGPGSKPHEGPTTAPNHVHQTANHGHGGPESKPKGRHRRSFNWPKTGPKPEPKPEPKPDNGGKHEESGETFYGVFQLSDQVACSSGSKPTLKLCGLTCDKLVDDDITDDIACLRTLISKFTPVDSLKGEAKEHVKKLYDQMYQKQCAGAADAQFFSGC